jgi:two-component system, response regulator
MGAIQMDTGRYNLLLVDDDPVQIDVACRAAAEACPEIDLTAVAGGDDVLDWFSTTVRENKPMPHIILQDLKLPKLDGLAVLRQLRSYAATSAIPIVVYSTAYTHDDVLLSYKAGANSFLEKPLDLAGYIEFFRERLAHWIHPQRHEAIFSAKDGAVNRV